VRLRAQELNEATFKPDIKTPCICGKGKGLRESTHSEVSKHTLYCQKFMKSCEAVNKTAGIQLMSDQMQRRVKHLWDYVRVVDFGVRDRDECVWVLLLFVVRARLRRGYVCVPGGEQADPCRATQANHSGNGRQGADVFAADQPEVD
jgi:hypothetical protein